jgi:hypothetical protein
MSESAPINPRSPELALRELGLHCAVEARGNLAIVIPAPGERALEDATVRRTVLATLRARGFTHAAVEPSDERAAPVERGDSSA